MNLTVGSVHAPGVAALGIHQTLLAELQRLRKEHAELKMDREGTKDSGPSRPEA